MTKHLEPEIPQQESGKSHTVLYHSTLKDWAMVQLSYITICSRV